MEKRKTIAVDLDDVTWEIMDLFIPLYNKIYNENIKIEDINKWDFFLQNRFNIIYPKVCKKINEYTPIDEMISYYINILNKFYDVSFLTHGKYKKRAIKKKLKTWGIIKGRSYKKIIIEKNFTPKVGYDFDYIIDDNPIMVEEIQDYPEKTLLLFTSPWNRYYNVNNHENVIRVYNWEEIFRFFENKYGKVLY